MSYKISIIVPVYKVEKYLDKCIQSIVDQTYSDLEIILVDDGSPDRCPEICDEWSRKDSRIRVIHQENAGVSAARNAGIRMAQGDYLYFVDGDDWIVPTLCEEVMKKFVEYDVDIVTFDCDQITESGESLGSTETLREGMLSQEDALRELLRGHINNYSVNKIYRCKVFRDICFPPRTAFEDMAIAYKLFLNAKGIYCLNEKLYFYLQRDGSATSRLCVKKLGELFLSRWESYVYLKPIYPDIAEIVFPRVVLCAIRLYDRFLWERGDEEVYALAMCFLEENRDKILRMENASRYRLFYRCPAVYKALRLGKHYVGNTVRAIERKVNHTG